MRDLETIKAQNEKAVNEALLKALDEGRMTYKEAGDVLRGWGYENNLPKNLDGEVLTTAKEEFAKDDRPTAWTTFYDLCGGGFQKTDYSVIIVEADEKTALEWFTDYFGLDPTDSTCECCGPDFSISEWPCDGVGERLRTEAEMRAAYKYKSNILVVRKDEIGGGK